MNALPTSNLARAEWGTDELGSTLLLGLNLHTAVEPLASRYHIGSQFLVYRVVAAYTLDYF